MPLPMRGLASGIFTLVAAAGLFVGGAGSVQAASAAVEAACESDYMAYCSQHDPDSSAGRNCMNMHGNQLSKRCVDALVKAGEVTKAEVERRAARGH